jgi:predicted anti-sigma-YlaC factor YlaD
LASQVPYIPAAWTTNFRPWGAVTMSCRDTIHLICWYLEGRLSPAVEAEIENHLTRCDDCRMVQEAATTTLDREFGSSSPNARRPQMRPAIQAA